VLECDASELEPLLDAADAMFLNRVEADHVLDQLGLDIPALCERHALRFCVVTEGERGCVAWTRGSAPLRRACRADRVVDDTGAGDAFAGAFLAAYLDTGDLAVAAERGVVLSSFIVEQFGCQSRIPLLEEMHARTRAWLCDPGDTA
jgi:ribokinase